MVSMAQDSPIFACRETELAGSAVAEVLPLFAHCFGKEMRQTHEQWNAELRALYFAFPSRGKGQTTVLNECIWLLSADGCTLRYLTCQKREDGTRHFYRERVQHAVTPYLFLKLESDAAYFSQWNPEPLAHPSMRVKQLCIPYKDCSAFPRALTAAETAMVKRGVEKHLNRSAEHEELPAISCRVTARGENTYDCHIRHISEDAARLSLISATCDDKLNITRAVAHEYKRVAPGVYVGFAASRLDAAGEFKVKTFAGTDAGELVPENSYTYMVSTQQKL